MLLFSQKLNARFCRVTHTYVPTGTNDPVTVAIGNRAPLVHNEEVD